MKVIRSTYREKINNIKKIDFTVPSNEKLENERGIIKEKNS